jgi:hypothetical protein
MSLSVLSIPSRRLRSSTATSSASGTRLDDMTTRGNEDARLTDC